MTPTTRAIAGFLLAQRPSPALALQMTLGLTPEDWARAALNCGRRPLKPAGRLDVQRAVTAVALRELGNRAIQLGEAKTPEDALDLATAELASRVASPSIVLDVHRELVGRREKGRAA